MPDATAVAAAVPGIAPAALADVRTGLSRDAAH